MSASVKALIGSNAGPGSAYLKFLVEGTTANPETNPAGAAYEAQVAALAFAPSAMSDPSGQTLDNRTANSRESDAQGVFEVEVQYNNSAQGPGATQALFGELEAGHPVYSFEVGGESIAAVHGIAAVADFPTLGGEADVADYNNTAVANGLDAEGNAVATQIMRGSFNFTVVKRWKKGTISSASSFIATLTSLAWKTNDGAFYGCAPGEALFMGATCPNFNPNMDVDITYRFGARPNSSEDGETVCGISGVSKKGWEYAWPHYKKPVLTVGTTVARPAVKCIHVVQEYGVGDFSTLGIGVA